jgi:hypothetical protein
MFLRLGGGPASGRSTPVKGDADADVDSDSNFPYDRTKPQRFKGSSMARHGQSDDAAAAWTLRAMRGSFVDQYLASSQDDGRLLSSLGTVALDGDTTLLDMAASVNCCHTHSCCVSQSCCASQSACIGAVETELDRRLSHMRPAGRRLWPAALS